MNSFNAIPAPPSTAADDSFYGTLDLGHATQINDDLVRAIRDEIADIDGCLRATSESVRNEERSLVQLTRDCHHARDEMAKHRRDAAEALDSENMTDELRGGFRAQFAAEVAPHVVSPSSDVADDVSVILEGSTAKAKAFSHKTFIERKRSDARNKAVSIHSIQQEIKATRIKIKAVDDETARYDEEVHVRQLDRLMMEGERDIEAKRRECEAEGQRNRGVREALQVARANSGAYAQQIAEKANEQVSERSSNASRERALTFLNETKERELVLLETDMKKLDEELAVLSGQLDFMVKQADEFKSEQNKSVEMKAEVAKIEREIEEVATIIEHKAKEAEASHDDLQSALVNLEDALKDVAKSNTLKLENDKAEVEMLAPANARKGKAIKEKEQLAGNVEALQKLVERNQNDNVDAATTSQAKVIEKSNELKEHKSKLDEVREDLNNMRKRDAAAEAILLSEKREYEEFATKFEAATNAEITRLEVLSRERSDAREGLLEERRADLDRLKREQREAVDILKQACAYLQEVREWKLTMEEAPLLDDDGDMNVLPNKEMSLFSHDDTTSVNNEAGSPQPRRSKSARRKL